MTVRNLDQLFEPASVVVVGASSRTGSLGALAWQSLRAGGGSRAVYAVNLRHHDLGGERVYGRVRQLPEVPQLAVVCTPARTVPGLVAELGAHGTRAVVVLTPDMSVSQQQAMLEAAGRHTLRILGPGSAGLWHPAVGLHAGVATVEVGQGDVALVSQSGAVVAAMLDWAQARDIGFSKCVSLGAQLDVDASDVLDFLGSDPATKAILLCVERVGDARKFMSAARAAARNKPVVVVKSGRTGVGLGTSEGVPADAVFDAAIARAGMLRVNTLQDLFLAAEILTRFRQSTAERLVVLANGRGLGAMAADAALAEGVPLAPLDADTFGGVQAMWPRLGPQTNPVRMPNGVSADEAAKALQALLASPDTAVLWVHAPTAATRSADLAQAVLAVVRETPRRLLGCCVGAQDAAHPREALRAASVPTFDTPEQAVRAFAMLRTYRHNQTELLQTPPARVSHRAVDVTQLRGTVAPALRSAREWLTEAETQALLVTAGVLVATAPERRQCGHGPTLGVALDPLFGPVLVFGQGDWAQPLAADLAVALPPLNMPLALALVNRTQVGRSLSTDDDPGTLSQQAVAEALVAVSQLLVDVPELVALDIHALYADAHGVSALGARVRVSATRAGGADHFAIQPYPQHLEESTLWHGQPLTIRPIRPEDEAQHLAFLRQMTPEDIRMRVFYSRRHIEHTELARLTQIDYNREMAFIATRPTPDGGSETVGVVRATVDPDNDAAEFGLLIRSDLKGGGLGRMLMLKMIDHLRRRGTQRLVGTVLRVNVGMLGLAQALGFEEGPLSSDPHEHDIRCVSLPLQTGPSATSARATSAH